ncbi:MAG: hypothetical protein RIS34_1701 [Pseudomonadota bacterium]
MAHGLEAVNWQMPWLAPWQELGQAVTARVSSGQSCHAALNAALGAGATPVTPTSPVTFVAQADLPPGQAYEHYIFNSKQCPTREGLHDFFNGLCWIHFPQTKQKLNQLQAAQIQADGVQPVRGAVRDALTVFDENAAFLHAPDPLWDALVAKDWQTLFVDLRSMWAQARLVLFGHALLEKLVSPRKAITAHVYRAQPATDSIADLDAWVAQDMSAGKLAGKPFAHLPVLGVPGWWPANEDPDFYRDLSVFRLPRQTGN